MKIKAIIFTAVLVLGASSAFAQETNRDANGKLQYGPYETNAFLDNWFVSVGGGINYGIADFSKETKSTGMGLALDLNIGKWFTPEWGARLGWNGLSNGNVGANEFGDARYNYIHVDGLVNLSNLLAGYKEKRIVSVVPFVTGGAVIGEAKSVGGGFGIMLPIRFGKYINLVPEVSGIAHNGDVIGGNSAACTINAALSLQVNLGKSNWTRKATSVGVAGAALAAAEAAKNALQAKNDKLAAEAAKAEAAKASLEKENAELRDAIANAPKVDEQMQALLAKPACVYFEIGQAKLSKKEKAHLDYIVKNVIANGKNLKFTVAGNADSKTGSSRRNLRLSEQRAKYVYDLLVGEYGLCENQFEVVANGGNDIFSTQELNRAVIIEKK